MISWASSFAKLSRTMVSKTTCEKEGEGKLERKELVNPMLSCCKEDNCSQFNVSAKGFFSLYKEKMTQVIKHYSYLKNIFYEFELGPNCFIMSLDLDFGRERLNRNNNIAS